MQLRFSSRILFLATLAELGLPILSAQLRISPYETGKLPKAAQEKINRTVNRASESRPEVFIFDSEGSLQNVKPLSDSSLKKSDSLKTLIEITALSCENPRAIDPPPTCAICESGKVICTNAKLEKSDKRKITPIRD